jgi:hypothetical protein
MAIFAAYNDCMDAFLHIHILKPCLDYTLSVLKSAILTIAYNAD